MNVCGDFSVLIDPLIGMTANSFCLFPRSLSISTLFSFKQYRFFFVVVVVVVVDFPRY